MSKLKKFIAFVGIVCASILLLAGITKITGYPQISHAQGPVQVVGINSGGDIQGGFVSDTDFSGGQTYSSTHSVDTSGVTDPAPGAVYQTVRYGNVTYTIPNLTPSTNYTIRLHFNELYWGTSLSNGSGGDGSRLFNVSINGTQVLNNYDIYHAAGGANKAIVEQFPATSDNNGKITIIFTSVTDNAMVNGIEIDSSSSTPTPTPTNTSGVTTLICPNCQFNSPGGSFHQIAGKDVTDAYIPFIVSAHASYVGTIFKNANMYNFQGTGGDNFTGADFTNADLSTCLFDSDNFTSGNFTDAKLGGCEFTNNNLTGITWSNTTCADNSNSNNNGNTCVGHLNGQ